MVFDTREYIASQEPPVFVAADGTRYVGRVLSMPQWQRFEERVGKAKNKELAWPELQRLILDLCDAFFPPSGSFWSYLTGRRRTVRWHVQRLPPIVQMQALWDFMRSQASAAGVPLPEETWAPAKMMRTAPASPASATP